MPGQREHQRRRRKSSKPSIWAELRAKGAAAGLQGHRQWELLARIESLGCGKYPHKGLCITRKELARQLGLDTDVQWDGRNTGRREHRLEELQLLTIVLGGGRLRGCSKQRWRGRANRLYPGPAVHPAVLVRQLIEADDQREAAITEQLDGSPPPTRGERLASHLSRGRAPGPDPP